MSDALFSRGRGVLPAIEIPPLLEGFTLFSRNLSLSQREQGFRRVAYAPFKLWNATEEGKHCYKFTFNRSEKGWSGKKAVMCSRLQRMNF